MIGGYDFTFKRLAEKQVHELMAEKARHLVEGSAASDFPEYREVVGYLRGLRTALDVLEQVATGLNRGELDGVGDDARG